MPLWILYDREYDVERGVNTLHDLYLRIVYSDFLLFMLLNVASFDVNGLKKKSKKSIFYCLINKKFDVTLLQITRSCVTPRNTLLCYSKKHAIMLLQETHFYVTPNNTLLCYSKKRAPVLLQITRFCVTPRNTILRYSKKHTSELLQETRTLWC